MTFLSRIGKILLLTLALPAPAVAQTETPPAPAVEGRGDSIEGDAQRMHDMPTGHKLPSKQVSTPRAPTSTPPPTYIAWPELRADPATGSQCLYFERRPGDPSSGAALESELATLRMINRYPACPGSQPTPARPSPGAAAYQVWHDQMSLPRPEPRIAPGRAITGLDAYLEIGGTRARTESFSVFGYALTISATGTSYDVDWGDGHWSRGVRSSGGPWPHGNVRHVYTVAGTYTVRVFENWSGTWSVAGGPLQAVMRSR